MNGILCVLFKTISEFNLEKLRNIVDSQKQCASYSGLSTDLTANSLAPKKAIQ